MNILRELRDQTGRTQIDVAEEVGISREYLCMLERGKCRLTRGMAEKLARIYGVSPGTLLGYQTPEQARTLKDERDLFRDRYDQARRDLAQERQAYQKRIEEMQAEIERLQQDLRFTQSICKNLMAKNKSEEEQASETENR